MKQQLLLVLGIILWLAGYGQNNDTTQYIIKGRANSPEQQKKPYVIMISVDAMRYDYIEKCNATNLITLGKTGVRAEAMMPSYPSITFPNHYTLVTGLYPSHHGIVCNKFYDRNLNDSYSSKSVTATEARWYGGTPLWVLAEQQKMLSAAFYWVGSDAEIQNTYPTYRYKYNEKISIGNRIKTVINWLKLSPAQRPHLINLYFPQVDYAGHHFGPDAPETHKAVLLIDSAVNELQKQVKQTGLDVNFIFLSDHGMVHVDNKAPLSIPPIIDTAKFNITGEDVMVELYAKDTSAIKGTYEALLKEPHNRYAVYLGTNTPKHWHYNKANDRFNRIADILLIPKAPNVFIYTAKGRPNPGAHGYDPTLVPQMKATFYAWGPNFKTGLKIPMFNNVDVYPLVAQLLGLTITQPVDGSIHLAKKLLIK
ncbi:alkaline phosphatase family protein [Mucilaginibacter terrae]|uniref:AlkP superfamily pyrophosphatase or phosphodiesterase n=1 Tax=Mucilaginibacter terrae TaxID=1955052 RepID=A0ABU3GRX2_9SPHI|nr:ectonucleotide pyrophosphatase/phosphodiesterase [Mucilaginibacter terrae]MDT3402524.1 putative AlkP superfamily pyrophosphatase or phosphodiesterase [Mucilaginibacter terrae]